jgi:hypothetical protein
MAAHAVGEREQPRSTGVAIAHAVFVLLAATLAADLVDGEPHAPGGSANRRGAHFHVFAPVFKLSICSFKRSLKLSLV